MTKRRSIQFKVSKPATPALEKAITEYVSNMDRRTGRFVKMVVKSLAWRLIQDPCLNCEENEIIDGIKDMANKGKLRLGSNKLPRNDLFYIPRKYKTFADPDSTDGYAANLQIKKANLRHQIVAA